MERQGQKLFANEMFDFLAGQSLHIDVFLDRPEAYETFGEELARAKLERFGVELGHYFQSHQVRTSITIRTQFHSTLFCLALQTANKWTFKLTSLQSYQTFQLS